MDRCAGAMTARGPTLAADRETWTGSLHIVDLPSPEAAREFVEHEPYNRAGLYEHHTIHGFENLLGRTMWDFPLEPIEPRFLVIADADVRVPSELLIVHGRLLTLDDAAPAGVALALQVPSREAVAAAIADARAEIHDWEFGGRR
jgi:hypothetical protein